MTAMLMAVCAKAQDDAVYAFGYDKKGEFTNVRNAPNGKVVDKIPTSHATIFVLVSPCDGWWRVAGDAYEDMDVNEGQEEIMLHGSTTGYWIHHSVVACDTRNYGNETLYLKELPRKNSKTTATVNGQMLVHPIDVSGDWTKVKLANSSQTGWIETVWLCSNPVTTCP